MIPTQVDDDTTDRCLAEWARDAITQREEPMSMRELVESGGRALARGTMRLGPPPPGRWRAVVHSDSVPPRVKTVTCYARTAADARRVIEGGVGAGGWAVVAIEPVTVSR